MSSPDQLDLGPTIRGLIAGQKLFGRYVLVRILGRGGMGVVWLAKDEKLERDVALKFLPELVCYDAAALDELKRETKRSFELTHHHIVRIHDFAHDAQTACISMEYVDGPTLSALRVERPNKVLDTEELLPLIEQVCAALDYAHSSARIVHRDLKPANLMLNNRREIKVADFGIARSLTDTMSMLTRSQGVSGTLIYMSPQQLDGERPSHLDDIYSLGATIYELLTGKPPFYTGQIERQIREKLPPRLNERRNELAVEGPPVPGHLEATIASCLAKNPAERPQRASEVCTRLRDPLWRPVTPNRGPVAVDMTIAATRKGLWYRFVILLALVGCATVVTYVLLKGKWTSKPQLPTAATAVTSPAAERQRSAAKQALYPPPGFAMEEPPLAVPGLRARLEQWLRLEQGSESASRQVWLVPGSDNAAVQLPDFAIPKLSVSLPDKGITADTAGSRSTFSFSPDGAYLFRAQKLAAGIGGAYLYRQTTGLNYEIAVPDLFIRACEFFTQTSGTELEGGVGVVGISAWSSDNRLMLVIRGQTKDGTPVSDWRCTFDPTNRKFASPEDVRMSATPAAILAGSEQMKPQHAETLRKWLATQSNLRLVSISDYSAAVRSKITKLSGSHPFYVSGDFNRDGLDDFAIKLVRDGKTKEYHVVVFNGLSTTQPMASPAFIKGGFDRDDWLIWSDNELIIVDSEGTIDHLIKPRGTTYVVEERVDV